ncbi:hypothetical protein EYY94_09360 [Obesumbacterium proteus]|uniref:hypothetical protein n=1 Tax=Obesumbacterium proteus TaxID=82983 RepID=UPI001034DE55|nr:hypothetical protein [Obesumbacterium proteus]TBL75193.1 hypothetical protein EYY94_09360 [Obesumbacterium proteus]
MKINSLLYYMLFYLNFPAASAGYPPIIPIHKQAEITSENTTFEFYLLSEEKIKIYEFVCRDGNYYDEADFGNFSGFYQCKLIKMLNNGQLGADVLAPDISWRSSVTRARFDVSSIIGGCRNHPEYGHERVFFVQGMKVVINIHDLKPTAGMVNLFDRYKFTLDVNINNHPSSSSEFSGYEKEVCTAEYERIDQSGNYIDKVKIIKQDE